MATVETQLTPQSMEKILVSGAATRWGGLCVWGSCRVGWALCVEAASVRGRLCVWGCCSERLGKEGYEGNLGLPLALCLHLLSCLFLILWGNVKICDVNKSNNDKIKKKTELGLLEHRTSAANQLANLGGTVYSPVERDGGLSHSRLARLPSKASEKEVYPP